MRDATPESSIRQRAGEGLGQVVDRDQLERGFRRVVEVDGSPVVIDAGPASTPASLPEVTKIVEGIAFQ